MYKHHWVLVMLEILDVLYKLFQSTREFDS